MRRRVQLAANGEPPTPHVLPGDRAQGRQHRVPRSQFFHSRSVDYMQIATWNLMRARPGPGKRTAALLTQMDKISPDVWVLTETFRELQPGPEYTLVSSSSDAPDREARAGECWVAIWSRLEAKPIALTADPERSAAVRLESVNGPATVVVGTVLPWLADHRYAPARGGEAFCNALSRQAAEWQRLQAAHSDAALCVAGDFNQDLAHAHYYGSKRGRMALRRALEDAHLVCLTAGSHDPLAKVPNHASVDHLCVSASLVANGRPSVDAWPEPPLMRGRLTDHFGVRVDLDCSSRIAAGSVVEH